MTEEHMPNHTFAFRGWNKITCQVPCSNQLDRDELAESIDELDLTVEQLLSTMEDTLKSYADKHDGAYPKDMRYMLAVWRRLEHREVDAPSLDDRRPEPKPLRVPAELTPEQKAASLASLRAVRAGLKLSKQWEMGKLDTVGKP